MYYYNYLDEPCLHLHLFKQLDVRAVDETWNLIVGPELS